MPRPSLAAAALPILATLLVGTTAAMETLTFSHRVTSRSEPTTITANGRVLAQDSVGNRFFETDEGARYLVAAADLVSESSDDRPFEPATAEEIGERLLAELPPGFRIHRTRRYVVAYDTSRGYAEWSASLLESLYKALTRYWRGRGLKLQEPEFPLPIVIHRSAADYQAAAKADGVGPGAVGYYSTQTNRVRMFDLTGSDELRTTGRPRAGSRREIAAMLQMPVAEPLVATIVHEATHQVCFNTGVMQRMADLPIWLVEGMAVFFEAPDAASSRGWGGIGRVNRRRLATFLDHLPEWNETSFVSLVGSDDRLRDPRTAGVAYADAWALNYYLLKKRRKDYVAYVKTLAAREPFQGPPADETDRDRARRRMRVFTEHFGDFRTLEDDFLRTMSRL